MASAIFFNGHSGLKSQVQLLSGRRLRLVLALSTKNMVMATISGILAGLTPRVQEVFDISGFSLILEFHTSSQKAVDALLETNAASI